ncbi:DUF4962 domain-containing protein [Paenibacillus sp. DMB20]|uniref:DUF4962 domain-containing protein n=1 Tax=Paenibacillus sp. DMB20 TaxID=1642570 RepID=UPI0006276D73|nr:DUF4962 domain-containing protein [Paenibacillus sp. DMB20]KKO55210.1 alginate lyase [Paenibacillus sp. DMB20]
MAEIALFQPESSMFTVQYAPGDQTVITENPPRFTWMAAQQEDDAAYVLQISPDESFAPETVWEYKPLPFNFFTPDRALPPGGYYWRYALMESAPQDNETPGGTLHPDDGRRISSWSVTRRFDIPEDLPETPLPRRNDRYPEQGAALAHPRLWLNPGRLKELALAIQDGPMGGAWDDFMTASVKPWMEAPLKEEPKPYPGNKRVAPLWRQMYIDCQEVLYAVRHLSIAGRVLNDSDMTAKAKAWLLHAAGWDPEGTTSRDYNDEAAFRVAAALAWGYDWLYDELSDVERDLVRSRLQRRTEQVAHHVMVRSKIHHVPYDSHAVRSLSSVLVPCCIALLHEEPQAREWLDYAVEYYACLYSPWGGMDGGWAEGPMYWTTGMAYVTEALNLLRSYAGIDFYRRPFFQKTGDFPLYVYPPDTIRVSFGDQSTLGDPVNLKTGYNIRQFAGVTGNPWYQWYYEQVKANDPGTEKAFYNYGWWDFGFDELAYRFDYPQVEAGPPVSIEPLKWFRDVGWVAMHHRMEDPDEHIMLLAKSSRYGSISHSHADQNSFQLHAFGEPLAADTGYYIAHGSSFHRNWRRQTHSKNGILIGGIGQYAENNKVFNMAAAGNIEDCVSNPGFQYVRADATAAYALTVPHAKSVIREIYFLQSSYAVIVDSLELEQLDTVQWLLHAVFPMELKGQSFEIRGRKAGLKGTFVYSSSGEMKLFQSDVFEGVDPAEYESLPKHYHLKAETRAAKSHRIVTLLVPHKANEPKYVPYFLDDQDHGLHLYCTDKGMTQKIEIPKAY